MGLIDNIPNLIISGTLCKEDVIAFLKGCKWTQMPNGKHYVGISGYLNNYPDAEGFNATLCERQAPSEYGSPRRVMWRGCTRELDKERVKQKAEFRAQNPELKNAFTDE